MQENAHASYGDLFVPIDPTRAVNDALFEKEFPTIPHSAYEWERAFTGYIRSGDVDGARRFMERMVSSGQTVTVGNVSEDQLTQSKFLAVSAMAIGTRVAISAGADELAAYQISDKYLQFLSRTASVEELTSQLFLSTYALIQLVRDAHEAARHSLYYLRCREYISQHLNQKISVQQLADHCGISQGHLSHVFKETTGMTIMQYVLQQRIRVAKQLLLSDEYKMSEIASFLGFISQSYFIACFKRETGMTPRQWKLRQAQGSGVELY